jgi:RNA polymerase sigma-70 factor (ECF subfamily)
MKYTPPTDIDPEAKELIRHKARRMAKGFGFRRADEADIRQELSLAAHLATMNYDPRRADAVTFYNAVIEHKAIDLLRRQVSRKRDPRRELLIDTSLGLGVQLDPRPATERRMDLGQALASLPPDDRDVAMALAEHTVMDVARRPGQSRERVRGARRRIRRHLSKRGLP